MTKKMEKMWAGRFETALSEIADDFNSSISFDKRMWKQDIKGSMAHATMLEAQGILTNEELENILKGLEGIYNDLESGALEIDDAAEDIHMFVESVLTSRIGQDGKKLHTARSRNDQVAVDLRMFVRDEADKIIAAVKDVIASILEQAKDNTDAIMPGYTHLQRAQPIVFSHHLLAYAMMLIRDVERLCDARRRMNVSPLGSCALAGTTYNTNRETTAKLLQFDSYSQNSIDGVSDRDFCLEFMSAFSILMMHLSRFSEEIILWSSWEFSFIELDDSFTTGSSIMPQKKNSDMAELVRGKTGRVYGDLFAMLTVLKGLPLAYNKDMQEDKEALFDAIDTVEACLEVFAPMIRTMKVKKDNMYKAAQKGFINATDLADYLVKKGKPFREAYKIVGTVVGYCVKSNEVLDTLPLEKYKEFSEVFDIDLYDAISLETCVNTRISQGGTGPESIKNQIEYVAKFLS